MYTPVSLQTARGDFVAKRDIPNFQTGYPDVLIWGLRIFKHHDGNVYRECHYWSIPLSPEEEAAK